MAYSTITPQQLFERVQTNGAVELIDVRTPVEFQEVHIPNAKNVPLDRLHRAELKASPSGQGELVLICKGGTRGRKACEQLVDAGFQNVVNLEGGTEAWAAAGLPVVRGKKVMSLERQVRIAAGLLVVLGSFLGFFVHPLGIALAAFVGAGLVFAGITDTCAMGMLIAKMPWNQVRAERDVSCQI